MPKFSRHARPRRFTPLRRRTRKRSARRLAQPNTSHRPVYMSRSPRLPIPTRAIVKLHQQTDMFLVAGSSTGNVQWISNICYRPWSVASGATFTGIALSAGYATTDSPNAFISYCSAVGLYQRYRVLSFGIKVSCTGPVNGAAILKYCVAPSNNGGAFAGFRTAASAANAVVCNPLTATVYQPCMLKGSWPTALIAGTTSRAVMDSQSMACLGPTAQPTVPMYLNLFLETGNQIALGSSAYFSIELFWTVQFEGGNGAQPSD